MAVGVGELARPVDVYTGSTLLRCAIPSLERGRPVVVVRDGDHFLLLPRAAVGHRPTRRLVDLPLERATPLGFATKPDEALDRSYARGVDYMAVAKDDAIVGLVSREDLLTDVFLGGRDAHASGAIPLLARVIENIPEGIVLLSGARKVRLANAGGTQMLRALCPNLGDGAIDTIAGRPLDEALSKARDFTTAADEVISVLCLAGEAEEQDEILLIMRDVTSVRRRQRTEALRDRMVVLGEFAGAIAHDFNNLLTVTLSHASLLERKLAPGSREADSVNEIRGATERSAALVRRLLTFGSRELVSPIVLDLQTSFHELRALLERLIGEDVRLVSEVDDELWSVNADPVQIERVLANLVVNARHAMPDGGDLFLRLRNVEVGGERRVRIEVEDTGIGMTDDVKAHIFEPYFTTRRGVGTGLGLATVHGSVAQLGGTIRVESAPGMGSRFEIDLPVTDAAPTISDAHDAPVELPAEMGVLLVEDDVAVGKAVRRTLQALGHRVTLVDTVDAAKAQLEDRHDVTLVITDLVLRQGRGSQLTSWIVAHRPALPTVLMSGYAESLEYLRTADSILAKPFTPKQLIAAIARALAGHALR